MKHRTLVLTPTEAAAARATCEHLAASLAVVPRGSPLYLAWHSTLCATERALGIPDEEMSVPPRRAGRRKGRG